MNYPLTQLNNKESKQTPKEAQQATQPTNPTQYPPTPRTKQASPKQAGIRGNTPTNQPPDTTSE